MRQVIAAASITQALGHGRLTLPGGRQLGSLSVAGVTCGSGSCGNCCGYGDGGLAKSSVGKPTICSNPKLITGGEDQKRCEHMTEAPWVAPGTAKVKSSCGVSGNHDGATLAKRPGTVWQRGTDVEVGHAIWHNHGGGYAYRLCPANKSPTEDCFRAHHLPFVGDTTKVHYTDGRTRTIPAIRTTVGTSPSGSQWTRNPVPNCQTADALAREKTEKGGCTQSPLFQAPFSGGEGSFWDFSLVDKVRLPANLEAGDYVLSWRWDCEVNKQIFINCADVKITAGFSNSSADSPSGSSFNTIAEPVASISV